IVAGDPEKSLLIEAVRYGNADLQMPPKKQLSQQQIADLTEWIKIGAPYPLTDPSRAAGSLLPVFPAAIAPKEWPIPVVKNKSWAKSPIDNFILAKLEEKNLHPANPANKRALIRR